MRLFLCFAILSLFFSTGNAENNPYAGGASIQFINSCRETIWPVVHTMKGAGVMPTGFKLDPKQIYDLNVPDQWSGSVWARTGCKEDPNNFNCDVGDCGTRNILCNHNLPRFPVTILKFDLAPRGGSSSYKLDLRTGFNVPVTLTPFNNKCQKIQCSTDIRQQCPDWLAVYSRDARKIACKSACLATRDPKHCCTGNYASSQKCPPDQYRDLVEKTCPSGVSNPFDKSTSLCSGGTSFMVTFCS